MSELSDADLVAQLIRAVADDTRKQYNALPHGPYVDRDVEAARQAVLARMTTAAARSTPDAEAMEQTFLDAVNAHTTEVIMSTKRGVISSDAEIAAFHRVMNLYRKAVTS